MRRKGFAASAVVSLMLLVTTMACFAEAIVEVNDSVEEQTVLKGTKTVIKVFETTDMHGYIIDASSMNEETFQYRLAYLANVVNQARAEYDDVILLNGGNNYEGTPLNENSAPIDNETLIAQLLKEAGEGKEIAVDTSARGTGTLKVE